MDNMWIVARIGKDVEWYEARKHIWKAYKKHTKRSKLENSVKET